MGRGEEVVFHFIKVLEIKEKVMKRDCIEIGMANKDVSDAYFKINNYKQALSFALKALEIYKEHLANDSKELAMLRMLLGDIYLLLRKSDKALEQNRLSLLALKSTGNTSFCSRQRRILISLGRHEEAVVALKFVISQSENAGNLRARVLAFMGMARAFCIHGRLANMRMYIISVVRILEAKGLNPGLVATGFRDMAELYKCMKEYDAAISLVQKALNIPEIPQATSKSSITINTTLLTDLSLWDGEKKDFQFWKRLLKEKFGPEHYHVGSAYGKLDINVPFAISSSLPY